MGAGASFDAIGREDGGGSRHFFCHSCQRNMSYSGHEDTANLLCPYCNSSFIEETPPADIELSRVMRRRQDLQDLSSDQSRRLASAAIMLRLLEAQLHGEVQVRRVSCTWLPHASVCVKCKSLVGAACVAYPNPLTP